MKTIEISLQDFLDEFINRQIESGNYHSASEVVQVALSLLIEYELERLKKLNELKASIAEGKTAARKNQGIDGKKFIQELIAGKS